MPSMERVRIPEALFQEKQDRRIYIRTRDVYMHGAAEGCPGCRAALIGDTSRNHTEECRDRMTPLIEAQDEARAERVRQRLSKELEDEEEADAEEEGDMPKTENMDQGTSSGSKEEQGRDDMAAEQEERPKRKTWEEEALERSNRE